MKSELWLQLLQDAMSDQPAAAGPHFVDDDQMLDRWQAGELSVAEHDEIVSHLAECGNCRDSVAVMVRQGMLVLPAVAADEVDTQEPIPASPQGDSPKAILGAPAIAVRLGGGGQRSDHLVALARSK